MSVQMIAGLKLNNVKCRIWTLVIICKYWIKRWINLYLCAHWTSLLEPAWHPTMRKDGSAMYVQLPGFRNFSFQTEVGNQLPLVPLDARSNYGTKSSVYGRWFGRLAPGMQRPNGPSSFHRATAWTIYGDLDVDHRSWCNQILRGW